MEKNSSYNKMTKKKKKTHFLSLFFFYIIPFIFINSLIFYIMTALPRIKISISEPINYKVVEISIIKKSLFPIKTISATFENQDLELKKLSNDIYIAQVNKNGTIKVDIKNLNNMSKSFYEYVGSIDDTPPTIEGNVDENEVIVTFSDEGSGIDYDSIYAIDSNNTKLKAKKIDKTNNIAIFKYENKALEVHISDLANNDVTANFSDRIE